MIEIVFWYGIGAKKDFITLRKLIDILVAFPIFDQDSPRFVNDPDSERRALIIHISLYHHSHRFKIAEALRCPRLLLRLVQSR